MGYRAIFKTWILGSNSNRITTYTAYICEYRLLSSPSSLEYFTFANNLLL